MSKRGRSTAHLADIERAFEEILALAHSETEPNARTRIARRAQEALDGIRKATLGKSSACSSCGVELLFSARSRGDGLCGPCSRRANGTQTEADLYGGAPDPRVYMEPLHKRVLTPGSESAVCARCGSSSEDNEGLCLEPLPQAPQGDTTT